MPFFKYLVIFYTFVYTYTFVYSVLFTNDNEFDNMIVLWSVIIEKYNLSDLIEPLIFL